MYLDQPKLANRPLFLLGFNRLQKQKAEEPPQLFAF